MPIKLSRRLPLVAVALASMFVFGTAAVLAKRKASTPEDRAQAVKFAHELEASPLSEDAVSKRKWLIEWYQKVPDITVTVCDLLGPLPGGEHPFMPEVLSQMIFSSGAYQIENPGKAGDSAAAQIAGVNGALNVYSYFVEKVPEGRMPFLDELLQKRAEGKLEEHLKEKVASCIEK